MDRGAWRATVHGVSKSRTQLSIDHIFTWVWLGKCGWNKGAGGKDCLPLVFFLFFFFLLHWVFTVVCRISLVVEHGLSQVAGCWPLQLPWDGLLPRGTWDLVPHHGLNLHPLHGKAHSQLPGNVPGLFLKCQMPWTTNGDLHHRG